MKPPQENEKRAYKWSCTTYALDGLEERLKQISLNYLYIIHDKDTKADGSPEQQHAHVLIRFEHRKSQKACCKAISGETGQNTLAETIKDDEAIKDYLTHKPPYNIDKRDGHEKHQYQEDELITNDSKYWESETEKLERYSKQEADKQAENEEFINDLLTTRSVREMCIKYGRDYMKNYQTYNYIRELLIREQGIVQGYERIVDLELEAKYYVKGVIIVAQKEYTYYLDVDCRMIDVDSKEDKPTYNINKAHEIGQKFLRYNTTKNARAKYIIELGEYEI